MGLRYNSLLPHEVLRCMFDNHKGFTAKTSRQNEQFLVVFDG